MKDWKDFIKDKIRYTVVKSDKQGYKWQLAYYDDNNNIVRGKLYGNSVELIKKSIKG